MDCCEFREKYSDFADGQLDEEAELRARRHLSQCAACRRFDAAFRTGVRTLRALPSVEVSRSFGDRLRGQLRHELIVRALAVNPLSGTIAAMLVLVTIGLVTWDLADLRAARHAAAAVAANAIPPAVIPVPSPVQLRIDTTQIFGDIDHPFAPVLLVADTSPAPVTDAPRFDVPAVWGRR
jgi:anti-sigma factor RsiW